ncbi:MAG: hypothetical protein RLY16_321 [Bacteroidota bacterium]
MARIILFFFTILFSVIQPKFASASDLMPAKQKYSSTTATFSNHFQFRNLNFDPYFIEFEDEEVNENENENFSFEKKANANFALNYFKSPYWRKNEALVNVLYFLCPYKTKKNCCFIS